MGELAGFNNIAGLVTSALIGRSYKRSFEPETDSNKPDPDNMMSFVDLTNLKVIATEDDISSLIERAVSQGCASVCIPPCYVSYGSMVSAGRIPVCTVIGFPNGYQTAGSKLYEALEACDNGASEIDMVINRCFVKTGRWDDVASEIKLISDGVHAKGALLKVIIETCDLTEDEKKRMCRIVSEAGADFIKTSTGFGGGGATFEDVELMVKNVGEGVKVKASGGIAGLEDADKYVEIGARRLGTSRIVKAVKGLEADGEY